MATKKLTTRRTKAQKIAAASKRKHATKSQSVIEKPVNDYRIPNVFRMIGSIVQILWKNWLVFGGLALIYGVLTLIIVQGVSTGTDLPSLKSSLDGFFKGQFSSLTSSLTVFVVILSSPNGGTNGWSQIIVTVIISLAIIWALRHVMAGQRVSTKSSLYQGMTPLIPFVLVLVVILIQLIPLIVGSTIYGAAMNGIAIHMWEKILWGLLYLGLGIWSGYMLSSSLFAMYIFTLPDMAPRAALRAAKDLVKGRRWLVVRKIIMLPILIVITYMLIMLPVIMIYVTAAPWVFFALTCLTVIFVHAYMYGLYRELINAQG